MQQFKAVPVFKHTVCICLSDYMYIFQVYTKIYVRQDAVFIPLKAI